MEGGKKEGVGREVRELGGCVEEAEGEFEEAGIKRVFECHPKNFFWILGALEACKHATTLSDSCLSGHTNSFLKNLLALI